MNTKSILIGLAFIVIGFVLLGRSLDMFYLSFGDVLGYMLPFGLIGIGVWLIVRRKRLEDRMSDAFTEPRRNGAGASSASNSASPQFSSTTTSANRAKSPPGPSVGSFTESPQVDPSGRIRYSKVFGDLHINCSGIKLGNVEVSSAFGDVEIVLRGGELGSGLNRVIVSGFVGDIRVFVPAGTPYFASCSNFVGDIEIEGRRTDGFGNSLEGSSADYSEASSKLYIACNAFLGDIRIYVV
ncbi:MAG: LiaF domain-containing protein [Candidatus Zixiibacteriota bacterium]